MNLNFDRSVKSSFGSRIKFQRPYTNCGTLSVLSHGVIIWTVFHLSDTLSCSYLGEKFSAGVLKDACVRV